MLKDSRIINCNRKGPILSGSSLFTIYKLKCAGKIPYYKRLGSKKLLFSLIELDQWLRGDLTKNR